ncbi:putative zinc-finger of transcription factor IIIC complex-domain-containing protein [Mycena maculata]|uniref:Zinc-finger of transcription factor IIIC complex-domain-containing protein n=1 Tax=Mycena maculata TaxID=230809 RepID=A0AAD7JVF7_9AGAR|nr:putative zinc-finger of transcription factor IIIC complex-domain-containing protein [Mycena maculata]
MSRLSIYTSLSVPMVACVPSATAFQWSADGQACFLTKTALYIMTPDHGLNYDPSSALRATPEKDKAAEADAIGWYRTLVQFDRPVEYLWPEQSQDWSSIALGSVDIALWAVTLSPSNISADASCILAALSSSMDLTLWTAGRNGMKGEWVKVYDITPFLLDHFSEEGNTVRALKSQVVCIKWSQQADFGLIPAPLENGSLLVAGTRAGTLLFLRYQNSSVELVETWDVSDRWIVCLAISSWSVVEPRKCEAYVAYATDDGIVRVLKIIQALENAPSTTPFGLNFSIQLTIASASVELCPVDQRPCNALEWVEIPGGLILVYSKAGVIYLWSSSHAEDGWSGLRALPIPPAPKLSVGMSPFNPVSGMHYVRRRDALLLCLFDGAFHMIHGLSRDPSWAPADPADGDALTSANLSVTARGVFARVEPGDVDADLVNRISGMASYDGSATITWVHEACRPGDFSYKHDAKHNSVFLVARMWDDTDDEALLSDLSEVLLKCRFSSGLSPAALLRPIFFNLNQRKLNQLHDRVLDILRPQFPDHSVDIELAPWTGALTPELRSEFRSSLTRHLYGWDVMLSLRMRLALADFTWKASETEDKRIMCGTIAQTLLASISHRVLRTIIRHLIAGIKCLEVADVPFVLRMIVQSLLPGSPPDLTAEGDQLSTELHAAVPANSDVFLGIYEACPACQGEVPLQDITSAVCPNGHTWRRCSITTFILSTPLVRTCVGCSRKAFLPLSSRDASTTANWLPEAGRGWVVEELLEAVHRCLFCGNSFVSIL